MITPPRATSREHPDESAGFRSGNSGSRKRRGGWRQCKILWSARDHACRRVHITWDNDAALKVETDGQQTRSFVSRLQRLASQVGKEIRRNMGDSGWAARWSTGGALKVVTTGLRPGYLRKMVIPIATRRQSRNLRSELSERRFVANRDDDRERGTSTKNSSRYAFQNKRRKGGTRPCTAKIIRDRISIPIWGTDYDHDQSQSEWKIGRGGYRSGNVAAYLTDDLALRAEFGCGLGQCGVVPGDRQGQAVRSCVTPSRNVAAAISRR